jgi:hypothetical protein
MSLYPACAADDKSARDLLTAGMAHRSGRRTVGFLGGRPPRTPAPTGDHHPTATTTTRHPTTHPADHAP